MSDLEKIKRWVGQYPGMESLCANQIVHRPESGSIVPLGLTELSREENLLGGMTVYSRWDMKLLFALPKAQEDAADSNAQWLMEFQKWVQEQSALGNVPLLGDDPREVRFVAQQGVLEQNRGEGVGIYSVKLAVFFARYFLPGLR